MCVRFQCMCMFDINGKCAVHSFEHVKGAQLCECFACDMHVYKSMHICSHICVYIVYLCIHICTSIYVKMDSQIIFLKFITV